MSYPWPYLQRAEHCQCQTCQQLRQQQQQEAAARAVNSWKPINPLRKAA